MLEPKEKSANYDNYAKLRSARSNISLMKKMKK